MKCHLILDKLLRASLSMTPPDLNSSKGNGNLQLYLQTICDAASTSYGRSSRQRCRLPTTSSMLPNRPTISCKVRLLQRDGITSGANDSQRSDEPGNFLVCPLSQKQKLRAIVARVEAPETGLLASFYAEASIGLF
jgi:hypothetical protein